MNQPTVKEPATLKDHYKQPPLQTVITFRHTVPNALLTTNPVTTGVVEFDTEAVCTYIPHANSLTITTFSGENSYHYDPVPNKVTISRAGDNLKTIDLMTRHQCKFSYNSLAYYLPSGLVEPLRLWLVDQGVIAA